MCRRFLTGTDSCACKPERFLQSHDFLVIAPLKGVANMTGLTFILLAGALLIAAGDDSATIAEMQATIESMQKALQAIGNQVMLQQFYTQERMRTTGNSGLTRIRANSRGTRPWHGITHTMRSAAALHNHANNDRTVGLGEFQAVLNGYEFRTRHNDYRLYQPSTTSSEFGLTQDIEFSPVPPEVTKLPVEKQVDEMREWFKAWRDQDHSVRDYRPYFKPVLCYLEGAWTVSDDAIEESFESDRHFLDAATWTELLLKHRFFADVGRKDGSENVAFLPKIINGMKDYSPDFVQWNYRIVCHPLKRDLPVNRFRVVDDHGPRMAYTQTLHDMALSKSARFTLNENDQDTFVDGVIKYGLMDELMSEIPGKDNYPADLVDDIFEDTAFKPNTPRGEKDEPLNAGYYHRAYKSSKKGAMGLSYRFRSYSDETCYFALTTNRKVAPYSIESCRGRGKNKVCKTYTQRWSYAVPLEIIYLTPLSLWDPYGIKHHGSFKNKEARAVTAGGRNGGATPEKAYDGTHSKLYYRTPQEFFSGGDKDRDPADTARQGGVGVLDSKGNVRTMVATGTYAVLPNIPGVGSLRMRYPIFPVFEEGNPTRKELEAVKDYTLRRDDYKWMYFTGVNMTAAEEDASLLLRTGLSRLGSEHYHDVDVNAKLGEDIKTGIITVESEEANGHTHTIQLECTQVKGKKCTIVIVYACDGRMRNCPDKHGRRLFDRKVWE